MNQVNKVLFIVLSSILILYISLLALVGDNDGNSFLTYFKYGYFLCILFFGFFFWLAFENQLGLRSYTLASWILMLGLPAFSIQTIRNISYNQANNVEIELKEILIPIVLIGFSLYFPIRTFLIREISFSRRIFPVVLFMLNVMFFIFLVNCNQQYYSAIEKLKTKTKSIEINQRILSSELGSPNSFCFCSSQEYKTIDGKLFYSVYTSSLDNAEFYSDIEEGDSVIKPANSTKGVCIKKSGESFTVEFVPE